MSASSRWKYVVVTKGGPTAPAFFEMKEAADSWIERELRRGSPYTYVRWRLVDYAVVKPKGKR